MQYARSTWFIVAVIATCVAPVAISRGQEEKKDAPPPDALKKGDEVIALRVAPLQVESETVGTVRKGDKLTVENVQGDWVWVRSGQTRGWIKSTSVIGAGMKASLERQADMSSVFGALFGGRNENADESGRALLKIFGVTFEIRSLRPKEKPGISGQISLGGNNYFMGVKVPNHLELHYGLFEIAIVEGADGRRPLSINGKPYGTVQQGDHVLITKSREVFVNGFRREPRG